MRGIACKPTPRCNLAVKSRNACMNRAIIFDMDGTLFQTEKILEPALEDTFSHLRSLGFWNAETPLKLYREIMGVPLPVVWATLLPDHSDTIRTAANDYFHQRLIENINAGKGALYPGATELLCFLCEKEYLLFIASNGQTEYLASIVHFYNLDRWIQETFSIQQIPSGDKGDLVQHIVEKYSIERGAVVGDRLSDIEAARKASLCAVGCNFYFAKTEELARADMVLNNFGELINDFKNWEMLMPVVAGS